MDSRNSKTKECPWCGEWFTEDGWVSQFPCERAETFCSEKCLAESLQRDAAEGRVVTSAPELLAACKAALPFIADPAGHRCMSDNDLECERCACAAQLRAAIRFAEGGDAHGRAGE